MGPNCGQNDIITLSVSLDLSLSLFSIPQLFAEKLYLCKSMMMGFLSVNIL